MRDTILVGETDDSIVEVAYGIKEDGEISFTGHTYAKNFFDNEEGETRAKDYLTEDKSLWKQAVESDYTTSGLEEWAEDEINSNGWMEVLGDIHESKNGMYTQLQSSGQIDTSTKITDFTETFIPKDKVEEIWDAWDKYHLKKVTPLLRDKITAIFKKYKSSLSDYNTETGKLEFSKKMYA